MAISSQQMQKAGASRRPACRARTVARAGRPRAAAPGITAHNQQRCLIVRAATEEEVKEVPLGSAAAAAPAESTSEGNWVPVCKPEDMPKGTRKEFDVDGTAVLMFWYRNQLYCIEARSPAEGAYSEGFIKAKFTQDYCIECPSTGSLFSLKDGSVKAWYPNNPVLRALTPQDTCRNMEIYPVKLAQDALYVDVTSAAQGGIKPRLDRGGAGTSLEDNNVFTVQPVVYFEGQDPTLEAASVYATGVESKANPATLAIGLLAAGIVGVAGTATFLYYEDLVALAVFWLVLGGFVAFAGYSYLGLGKSKDGPAR